MKKRGKQWLALLLVAVLCCNEIFAMNIHASEIQLSDIQNMIDISDDICTEENCTDDNCTEHVEAVLQDSTSGETIPEEAVMNNENVASDLQSKAATISSVYGPYKKIYVPSGVSYEITPLSKIAATIPNEAYIVPSDGSDPVKVSTVGSWSVDAENNCFTNQVNTDGLSNITGEGVMDISIPCTYSGSCNNYTVAFSPTQVKPGESYQLSTKISGSYNTVLGYHLSYDSSGNVSATLKIDSRKQGTTTDNVTYYYNFTNASVNDSGEYQFLTYNDTTDVSARNAYVLQDTATIDIRTSGNVSKVTGFAQKIYVTKDMATTDMLTKIAAVLPKKACVVSDLGDEFDVDTVGAWTYNASSGAFENKIAGVPSGLSDPDSLAGTTISMPYSTAYSSSTNTSITVTAKPTSVAAGGSTLMTINRYKTSYLGTWLCRLPDDNGSGIVYDTSSEYYVSDSSNTGTAYFNLTNLQSIDAGTYCAIIADTTSAATSRYAYISGTMAELTVTGGTTSCSHTTLTKQFDWNTAHTACTCTLTCSKCSEVVSTGAATIKSTRTEPTCTTNGNIKYTASYTYNGTTYTGVDAVPIAATGHTPKVAFSWSTDYETCNYTITCESCSDTIETGSATVTKETKAATCTSAGYTKYYASVTYSGQTYSASKSKAIAATGHTPKANFLWSDDHETCDYTVTCANCDVDPLASGTATVTKEATTNNCDVAGSIKYTATFTYSGKTYTDTYTKTIEAGQHTPKVTFTWSSDYETCKYTITCGVCSVGTITSGDATVKKETKAATCTSAGYTKYYASVTYMGETYSASKSKAIAATGHTPKANFLWSDDHETCDYTVTCENCDVDPLASGTATVTKESTTNNCDVEGSIKYTATFTYSGKTYTDTYTKTIEAGQHTPKVTFTWSSDYETCKYTITCGVCSVGTIASGDATVEKETKPATCTSAGYTKYYASVTYSGETYSATKSKAIAALGHTLKEQFEWGSDYKTCTCTLTCETCGDEVSSGAASISESSENATCSTPGKIVYTANYTYNGKTYTDTKTEETAILAHTPNVYFDWGNDVTTCNYTIKCGVCSEVLQEGDAEVKESVLTESTCTSLGSVLYTASVTYNDKTYGETKTVSLPKKSHEKTADFKWSTDCSTCAYEIKCKNCNASFTSGNAEIIPTENPATCTADGEKVYTASVAYDGVTYDAPVQTVTIPALGHSPKAVFEWSEDHTSCKYNIVCNQCDVTSLASGDAVVGAPERTESTCSTAGKVVYKASAVYEGKTYNDSDTEILPLAPHDYNVSFNWSTDHETCTYEAKCNNACGKVVTGDAVVEKETTKTPTCSEEGQMLYTAFADCDEELYTDTYNKILATLPHTPTVSPLVWSSNHESCSYTIECSECQQQIDNGTVAATKVTTAATCDKKGSIVYTASLVYNGATYSATPYTEEIPMLPHKLSVTNTKWSTDHSTCDITLGCSVCGNNSVITKQVSSSSKKIAATCNKEGSITYSASLTYDNVTYSVTPYVETLSKLSHNFVDGAAAEPTYRTEGHTAGRACSLCGQAELSENAIPSLAFSVTYNGNGATSGTMAVQSDLHYSVGGNLTKCGFTKTNCEFIGWNSQADGNGVWIDDLSDICDEDLITLVESQSGKVTLYAQWKRIKCSVTYNLDGGTNAQGNKSAFLQTQLPFTLLNPTKTGYVFAGWYTDVNFANAITTITTVENDLTLYAKWVEMTYQIEFLGNNATSGSMNKQSTKYTETGNLQQNTYERNGYVFVGWNTKSDGSGVSFADEASLALVRTNAEAHGDDNVITLYAQWRRNVISIYYILNDGINSENNPSLMESDEIILQNASKAGYTFAGWFSDDAYSNKVKTITNDNVAGLLDGDGHVTLRAKWVANKYCIKFKGNYATSGSMAAIAGSYVTGKVLPANTFKRTGYTFAGWSGSDGKTYKNKADIAPLATSTTAKIITLTAIWKKTPYTIKYVLNGGVNSTGNPATYTYTTATITLKSAVKKGYTFGGWYSDSTFKKRVTQIVKGSLGNKVLYAKWIKKVYTITYKLNGGVNNSANPVKYSVVNPTITLKAPTRKGYTFMGWYSDSTFKTKVTKIVTGSTGNRVLYAKWVLTKYKIVYKLNGGTNHTGNPTAYTMKTATFSFKKPVRKGYTFVGWYKDSKFTAPITGIKQGTTGNKTLYAKWKANKYNIKFNANGGTGTMSNQVFVYGDIQRPLTLNKFTKTGYTFVGWATSTTNAANQVVKFKNGQKINNLSTVSGKTINLYAVWIKNTTSFRIIYNLDGGTNHSLNPNSYKVTSPTITLYAPMKEGYAFAGWYSDANFKNKVTCITKGSFGPKTLYAKWIPLS
ncbi:MAG: InlB B-repeat-containing protein [Lachnospiraceae bacterium]